MKDPNEMNMDEVMLAEVIICTKARRGKGVGHSPIRCITEVFNKDGKKIAEHDPVDEKFTHKDMVDFSKWMFKNLVDISKIDERKVDEWLDFIDKKN
jgi:hypothetical protein